MAEKTVKQKIELTGEKQYSAAIREAQRNLRTLRSELKAETAELGRNASQQEKNETKTKSLKRQISEQEKVVETLKAALEQAKKEYSDNGDVIAKWETKLNDARTSLANMKNSLEDVSSGTSEAGRAFSDMATEANTGVTATKSLADAITDVGSAGEAVSDKIGGIFGGLTDFIKEAAAIAFEEISELAGRANAWSDLAGFWNTSAVNIQKWYHAVESTHNSFDDLNSAVTRITANQDKAAKASKVSAANYADNWEYAMAVMDSMAGMDYEQRLAASEEIFGEKRATKILDLLNDWSKIRGNLAGFDVENGGIGMSEEELSTMSDVAEKIDHIEQTWRAFKDSFVAGAAGELTLDLAGSAQGALDALIGFMNAEDEAEREEMLKEFEKNIKDFFERLGTAISEGAEALDEAGKEMQGSENGWVRTIGTVLSTLSELLNWFTEEGNIDLVIKGFEALAAFWIAGKGASMAAKIAAMVANINVIKAFGGSGAAAGAAGSAASGAATGAAGAGIGAKIGSFLGSTGAKILGGTGAFLVTLLTPGDSASGDLAQGDDGKWYDKDTGEHVSEPDRRDLWFDVSGSDAKSKYENEEVTLDDEALLDLTEAQRSAAEDYWDAITDRDFLGQEELAETMEELFADQPETLSQLMSLIDSLRQSGDTTGIEDLPDWWFNGGGKDKEGLTSGDISGFLSVPEKLSAAAREGVSSGISGIRVTLDGYTVGQLVAPYVSQAIGTAMM